MAFGSHALKEARTAVAFWSWLQWTLHSAQAGDFLSDAKQGSDTMLPHASNRYTRATLEQLAAQAAVEETKRIVAEHGELTGLRITCRRKRADLSDALSLRLS